MIPFKTILTFLMTSSLLTNAGCKRTKSKQNARTLSAGVDVASEFEGAVELQMADVIIREKPIESIDDEILKTYDKYINSAPTSVGYSTREVNNNQQPSTDTKNEEKSLSLNENSELNSVRLADEAAIKKLLALSLHKVPGRFTVATDLLNQRFTACSGYDECGVKIAFLGQIAIEYSAELVGQQKFLSSFIDVVSSKSGINSKFLLDQLLFRLDAINLMATMAYTSNLASEETGKRPSLSERGQSELSNMGQNMISSFKSKDIGTSKARYDEQMINALAEHYEATSYAKIVESEGNIDPKSTKLQLTKDDLREISQASFLALAETYSGILSINLYIERLGFNDLRQWSALLDGYISSKKYSAKTVFRCLTQFSAWELQVGSGAIWLSTTEKNRAVLF